MPLWDERQLFELLILEGAQAGLSWLTILRKRAGYRRAFDRFDPDRMARYGGADLERLLADPGIVRNRAKIEAAVGNARALLRLWDAGDTLADTLWRHVDGEPVRNAWASMDKVPASTRASEAMSRELKHLGFRFVGPTICYALMQSAGLVDDHLIGCFRHGSASS